MSGQGYRLRKASRTRYRVGHNIFVQIAAIVVACGVGYVALDSGHEAQSPVPLVAQRDVMTTGSLASSSTAYRELLRPGFALGTTPSAFGAQAPLQAGLQRNEAPVEAARLPLVAEPSVLAALPPASVAPAPAPTAQPAPAMVASGAALAVEPQAVTRILKDAPLPAPRPADLRGPQTAEPPAIALRQPTRRAARVAAATPAPAVEDNRSFLEKLFGAAPQPRGPAMAYAAPEDDAVDRSRGRRLSPSFGPPAITAQATAIYDISAKTVHMPNGEKLEAHSGFGEKMDDPRFVHVRMHGATPPHTYNLVEREALFHGHRALRMHPVGGSSAIFGRAGLLTHPYLLGPNGQSNGCVSFKDYDRFLQAYLRGEVKRLVVVASMRDAPASLVASLTGR
ncbi:DUF2778 domain-containing protein [Bosea sp. (in: a-proteobacteria)]|uniref:DUF2778 domain-containing protein n=1 Tax=Bosea sp. (in: a-proteobacteria) TaxID=1871050 RepID=UPI002733B1E4|nr:DUF2778 domain-containing protein [Bosea sp. (in: a-proteobacteria)]MDP3258523.1 DUF2778 domain-containing protein [Bosea sp. (in: a-proteobacteria)]